MTFCYQRQCEDSCYSPCSYGTVCSSRSYDCGSPCGYQGYYGRLCGYRQCCPSFSPPLLPPPYSLPLLPEILLRRLLPPATEC
uniref:Epidermal differentiation protein n=1 Tax=Serinus canaria TaxID=9135 RepID=A0A8C9KZ59_SERCA